MIHTFNVKPNTRDRMAGLGGELSAKQEKLEFKVTTPHRIIVVSRRTSVGGLTPLSSGAT